ncbi:Tim44-like domain-containing protein [Desulfovibrio aminophilus]|nr:TIM44-like domain-containing protein [Desulfovibrio aminophilus]MCM0755350.1 Tim44-like domain-containing protein [Desulfovibrio aminophilus]
MLDHTTTPVPTARAPRGRAMLFARRAFAALLAAAVLLASFDLAEAKRLGGGRSFGGGGSYSKPYNKPTPPPDRAGAPTRQQDNAGQNQQAAPGQQAGKTGGGLSRFGGIGGMVGGLLMGGLIGSLLFGGGFGGGFGLLEMLLVGVGIFMLMKFFRSRRAAREQAAPMGGERFAYASGPAAGHDVRDNADGWGSLRSGPSGQGAGVPTGPVMPEGVDEAEFIAGAKALFARLQASWDRRDLEDIRAFTTSGVFEEIARQAQEDPNPGTTDVLMVEARVVEVEREGSHTVMTVLFDALLREDQAAAMPGQTREVWRIRRDESSARPEWLLDGIQQLAN